MQQAQLLPPDHFRKRDGTKMEASEVQRAMVVIKNLDNALKASSRKTANYSEGLVTDALAASDGKTPEGLKEFYAWLMLKREHAAVPKTTEQVLARFEELYKLKAES